MYEGKLRCLAQIKQFTFRHVNEGLINSTLTSNTHEQMAELNPSLYSFFAFFQDIQSEPKWGTNYGSRLFPSSFYSSTVSSQTHIPGCTQGLPSWSWTQALQGCIQECHRAISTRQMVVERVPRGGEVKNRQEREQSWADLNQVAEWH